MTMKVEVVYYKIITGYRHGFEFPVLDVMSFKTKKEAKEYWKKYLKGSKTNYAFNPTRDRITFRVMKQTTIYEY